ncbi:GNAT family N-acetyltransferase [Longispora urticae]
MSDEFLSLPHQIYRSDPAWIPEEPAQVAHAFSAANRWHEARSARTFCLAGRARAAVFLDPACRVGGEACAFFGYWESAGDMDADRRLFSRIIEWATAAGAARLYGPIDFGTAFGYRVLLSAEPDGLPFAGEPYTPTWYGPRLQALGLRLEQRYQTWRFDSRGARAALAHYQPHQRRLEADGYRFSSVSGAQWLSRYAELHQLVNAAFADNFAFTPTDLPEFAAAFGANMLRRVWGDLSVLAQGPGGEIVGFLLAYPHYGPLIVQGAGTARIRPDDLDFQRHGPQILGHGNRCAIIKTLAVHPAHRRSGLAKALVAWTFHHGASRCDEYLGALIREDNASRLLCPTNSVALREYGLYSVRLPQ